MTNEEAIEWISYHIGISDYAETDDILKALKKAIKALEIVDMLTNRPCGVCKHHEHGLCASWNCPYDKVVKEK